MFTHLCTVTSLQTTLKHNVNICLLHSWCRHFLTHNILTYAHHHMWHQKVWRHRLWWHNVKTTLSYPWWCHHNVVSPLLSSSLVCFSSLILHTKERPESAVCLCCCVCVCVRASLTCVCSVSETSWSSSLPGPVSSSKTSPCLRHDQCQLPMKWAE